MTAGYIVSIAVALIGFFGGAWAFIQYLITRKDNKQKEDERKQREDLAKLLETQTLQCDMLIAMGHDRICSLGDQCVRRGSITLEEYKNLRKLYVAYSALGGNGEAAATMELVDKLPVEEK